MIKLISLIIVMVVALTAQSAHLISYQGMLTDTNGIPKPDSTYSIKFTIFTDSTAGQLLWTETAAVTTDNGLLVHLLGSTTPLTDFIFQNYDAIFLELSVGGETALPRNRLVAAPYSVSAGNLRMKDFNNKLAAKTNANEHSLSIYDSTEMEVIKLSGKDTANQAVQLPQSAIDFFEILDEPGLSAGININQVALFTGEMTDLVTVEITTPSDGYILLHGKCYLLLSGTTGPNNALVQIDEDEGGPSEFPYYTVAGLGGYINTGTSYFPIYVTRIFFASAGTYIFRMEGRASFPPPAEAKTWDHYLTAVYYPAAYDKIKAIVSNPAGFVQSTRVTVLNRIDARENGEYFEVDLQELKSENKK
ncbi:MAG: hypothetical protein ACREBV_00185 [Candidatus Zixiibacteriota bacterium]